MTRLTLVSSSSPGRSGNVKLDIEGRSGRLRVLLRSEFEKTELLAEAVDEGVVLKLGLGKKNDVSPVLPREACRVHSRLNGPGDSGGLLTMMSGMTCIARSLMDIRRCKDVSAAEGDVQEGAE